MVKEFALRRASGEPMAYILGDAIFCGKTFKINGSSLIPRPETEILTETADKFLKSLINGGVFADWCTGSGCIAITLLTDNPDFFAYAVDSSEDALSLARQNAEAHGVRDRIEFLECRDPLDASEFIPPESLDMIVSNPPYIPTSDIRILEAQVKDYEPIEALDGGADGLDVYRLLMPVLPAFMKRGAPLFLETGGECQAKDIESLGSTISKNLKYCDIFCDHCGIDRFMQWRKSA
jgi:release factor glutamine methyltransferase